VWAWSVGFGAARAVGALWRAWWVGSRFARHGRGARSSLRVAVAVAVRWGGLARRGRSGPVFRTQVCGVRPWFRVGGRCRDGCWGALFAGVASGSMEENTVGMCARGLVLVSAVPPDALGIS
jgi:hypothetical protein